MDMAIFCDQCGYQVTPLAASGRQWFFETEPPLRAPSQQADVQIPVLASDDLQESIAEPTKMGEQPVYSPLQKYIPKELMSKLETARASGTMAGERRIVTMLFCDVKGSTAVAEELDPEDWTEIINGAFEHMIKPVYTYEGTVARLMGDAILAFFGAPIAHEDDPQRAVLAGLDIVAGIKPYREEILRKWGLDIDVRVGINTGMVVVGTVGSDLRMEYTAMGNAINLAARMEQMAMPGSVQIAHDTYKIVRPLFDIEALGAIEVKGKEEPVPAYRVLGRKAVAGRQRGIEGLQTVLVGRDRELNSLNEILTMLHQGVGHIVSVIGEAGLGKSRLIREAKRSLPNATAVDFFETASLSYETTQPYGLFQRFIRKLCDIGPSDAAQSVREKLDSLVADLDEQDHQRVMRVLNALFNLATEEGQVPLEGEAFQRELFQIMPLLWRQRFGQRPIVLVFDDIHWSDPASIELLLHLLPLTAEIPLVLLCSYRPDRSGPVWRLRTMADETYHHRYTEIILRPLSGDQVDELVNNLLSVADLPNVLRQRIQERAAGIPFFVEEVVRSLIDSGAVFSEERIENGESRTQWRASGDGGQIEIPDSLQSLLAARIDRLQEETRQTLQLASVIGRSFYQRILTSIGNQNNGRGVGVEQELGRLLQLQMIREAARMPELEYKFSNPLTQEVAYQTILLKQRREFHRQVAEAIEALFPEQLSELSSQLAYHFREAREFGLAIRYLVMAGEAAFRLYANNEAIAYYDEALSLLPEAEIENELVLEIYSNRGRALELISDYSGAVENYAAMESEAEHRDDDRLRLGALIGKTIVHSTFTPVFDPDVGLPLAQKALEMADQLGEHASKADVLWSLLLVHAYVFGELDQAIQYGQQALELCRTWNLETQLPYVLNDLGRSMGFIGRYAEGRSLMLEARPLFETQNNLPLLADNSSGLSLMLTFGGELDEALGYANNGIEISRMLDNDFGIRDGIARVNSVRIEQGELGQAIAEYEEQFRQNSEQNEFIVFGFPNLVMGYAALGNTAAFRKRYESERYRADTFGPFFRDYFLSPLAYLYALEDRPEQAAEIMRQSNFDAQKEPYRPIRYWSFLTTAQLLFTQGHYDQVDSLVERVVDEQAKNNLNYILGDLMLLQADSLLAMDPPQPDRARDVLLQAKLSQERSGGRRVLWRILAALADLVEPDEALQLRQEARQIVSRIVEGIEDEELRQAFLKNPVVEKVMPFL
jgi:predicted ATPase/class 3 adenylate cyclase